MTTAYNGDFTLSRLERVLSGPGTTAALGAELDRLQRGRAVVVTGTTLGASPLLQRVTKALGARCAAVFTGARQHAPASAVAALVEVISQSRADCLVSFGGGSPIDMAKVALNAALTARGETDMAAPTASIVHVSLPTTLSASEYTSVAGVTDDETRVKRAVLDTRATAKVVIQDPELTMDTPDWLWAATGMRALDHAIEIVYAAKHHPYTDALCARAIAMFAAHLVPSVGVGRGAWDVEKQDHRAHCLMASWLSVVGLTHVGFGVSHALGHQLGPKWDIPHGITSCLTLPHAMRLMAKLVPERFEPIAQGFGVPWDAANPAAAAMACADRLAALITELGLPSRIRDLQGAPIGREELPPIAARVHEGMVKAGVSDKPVALEDVQALLDAAY